MQVHVKTHNDFDAVAGVVVLNWLDIAVGSVSYHTYPTIDKSVKKYLEKQDISKDDLLLIADICPSDNILAELDNLVKNGYKIELLDHHKTKAHITKYAWATFDVTKCATELIFDKFCKETLADPEDPLVNFVKTVSAWDLWKITDENRKRSENLNSLLGFIGKASFVKEFSQNINADLTEKFVDIIYYLKKRKNMYVDQVMKKQLETARCYKDGFNNRFKIIFATDFISEIGSAILMHPEATDLDYVCVINPISNSCSLRARKDEVDVSRLAQYFGGGGHAAAAGFPCEFTESVEVKVWKMLNKLNY